MTAGGEVEAGLLTLGEWPEAGGTPWGSVPPRYRELARGLESWLYLSLQPCAPQTRFAVNQRSLDSRWVM